MTNERLKQLHKLTGDLSKAMIDNDLWSSEAVEYAHDVRALIDAEAKRQSSITELEYREKVNNNAEETV